MSNNRQLKEISVPQELFRTMFEAYQKWEEFNDEFEDFLFGYDEKFVEKMRKAKREHLQGKTRNLKVLKQELM